MSGSTKLPNPDGMAGIMKRKIIVMPWSVKSLLYAFGDMIVGPGVRSSMRTSIAKMPPTRKKSVTAARNITPTRLWSRVFSHDIAVVPSVR